ncbi:2Fe-2S iron-sulfur cluster-binding protein [Ruegeria marina]|uniref:Sarcosine oxidase subunit alpha n=1 Tax=Ruegeria marina TaxID=639004 RepID=A0A1G6UN62_9RHOB|nr:2Fe-2S iron-sulfur cluster-binding protein [Ruegeria marina]SDD42176.1 sarcosine oxidase subunit alpha [Ruegeria marina]
MTGWRHQTLGRNIDRSKPLRFSFDGQDVDGFAGDTLASALIASGQRILGRSFKYHRPRGLWGMGAEEPNAVLDVRHGSEHWPNTRATLARAQDGMTVTSVNAWPTARGDMFRLMDLAHRFLPAGFYYKTFMALPWRFYEPMIRRMAGLGRVDPSCAPRADVAQVSAECDVLVIGAGPAGIAAAKAAAETGKRVWLVEESSQLGGTLRWRGGEIGGTPWQEFAAATREIVLAAGGRILTETTLWGAFDHGSFAAWERGVPERHWRIRSTRTILASGGIERPVWFANNDLPGVMSAEAAFHHLILYGAAPGRRVLLAMASDRGVPVARALTDAGVEVTLVDARKTPVDCGVPRVTGRIEAAHGRRGVDSATVNGKRIACDTILCAGGTTPTLHIWCQAGGKLDWDASRDMLVPRPGTAPMTVVGAAAGVLDLETAVEDGWAAGSEIEATNRPAPKSPPDHVFRPDPSLPGRQWIDLQNDVTLKDVTLAAREGFSSVEHLKRYTTLGMATDQGRTSNFAGLTAMAAVTDRTIPATGTTTYRPPFQPVPLRAIAGPARGALYHAPKRLTLEDMHRAAGARFREYGGWLRPATYGAGDETTVARIEAQTARQSVGVFDASPLGKLDVIGPGAADLLDFTGYVRMSTLKPGRARYGFMLSETGIVYDDGVVLRLAEDHFLVSTSSSHVEGVRYRLEDARQDRIGRGRVFIHDITQGFTTLTVTGPKAREMCRKAGIELPDLPHMGVGQTSFEGSPMRVARISFTGDLSYELSVPANLAHALHDRLDTALPEVGGCWIGLEAVLILRAEKGFILIGKDTDGATMPHDLGWGGPRTRREDEYIGKRSLFTPEAQGDKRRQLVGLRVRDGDAVIATGSHLIEDQGARRSLGFVTSSCFSPTLKRPIALALLENGRDRIGGSVQVFNDGEVRSAEVTMACAFDPKGEYLDG